MSKIEDVDDAIAEYRRRTHYTALTIMSISSAVFICSAVVLLVLTHVI